MLGYSYQSAGLSNSQVNFGRASFYSVNPQGLTAKTFQESVKMTQAWRVSDQSILERGLEGIMKYLRFGLQLQEKCLKSMELLRKNVHGVKKHRLLTSFSLKYYLFTEIVTIARDEEKRMGKRIYCMAHRAASNQQQKMINDVFNRRFKAIIILQVAKNYCYPGNPFACWYQSESLRNLDC